MTTSPEIIDNALKLANETVKPGVSLEQMRKIVRDMLVAIIMLTSVSNQTVDQISAHELRLESLETLFKEVAPKDDKKEYVQ